MNKKKYRFAIVNAIPKRDNANLAIKISKHTISQRSNELNLNSLVASTKPYVSKKKIWADWNLPLKTSYGLKNSGIVFISAICQSLTCSVVTEYGSFDAVLRDDIRLSAQKAALNLEEEVWWCLVWFLLLVQNLLSGYTVKLTQLSTKRYWRNMLYPIWELQLINRSVSQGEVC